MFFFKFGCCEWVVVLLLESEMGFYFLFWVCVGDVFICFIFSFGTVVGYLC